jgi:hypothetical protein
VGRRDEGQLETDGGVRSGDAVLHAGQLASRSSNSCTIGPLFVNQ